MPRRGSRTGLALCAISVLLQGCSTVYTWRTDPYDEAMGECFEDRTIPHLYGGMVFDIYCLGAENVGFFCLVDLPLSMAADTLASPYTLYRQIERGPWYSQRECEARREGRQRQPEPP